MNYQREKSAWNTLFRERELKSRRKRKKAEKMIMKELEKETRRIQKPFEAKYIEINKSFDSSEKELNKDGFLNENVHTQRKRRKVCFGSIIEHKIAYGAKVSDCHIDTTIKNISDDLSLSSSPTITSFYEGEKENN